MRNRNNDEAFILKIAEPDSEGEMHCFGFLIEERGPDGELLEMFLEPLQGEQDNLIGDNLLHFLKKKDLSYAWANFESDGDYVEIELDEDDPHPSRERGDPKRRARHTYS